MQADLNVYGMHASQAQHKVHLEIMSAFKLKLLLAVRNVYTNKCMIHMKLSLMTQTIH